MRTFSILYERRKPLLRITLYTNAMYHKCLLIVFINNLFGVTYRCSNIGFLHEECFLLFVYKNMPPYDKRENAFSVFLGSISFFYTFRPPPLLSVFFSLLFMYSLSLISPLSPQIVTILPTHS